LHEKKLKKKKVIRIQRKLIHEIFLTLLLGWHNLFTWHISLIKWIIAKFITKVLGEKQNACWVGWFPRTLIDMIVHKHGDKALAQYSNKF
jgi:hypothetical protein